MANLVPQSLAIIGGGPKAAAIAAKAFCMRATGYADVQVTVFEKAELGANWRGGWGYTDGAQRLCTAAERDLGFPYDDNWPDEILQLMQSFFSWSAFLLSKSGQDYANWIDRNCKPPTHRAFAEYVSYAIQMSECAVRIAEVQKLQRKKGKWVVAGRQRDGRRFADGPFDGVVVSGPGPTGKSTKLKIPAKHPRVFNGVNFWQQLPEVNKALRSSKGSIVLIGAGGTTAAIAGWLAGNGYHQRTIRIVANQPTLYARSHNYFENRIFSDTITWSLLGHSDRVAFNARLNRGVVWDSVMQSLESVSALELVPGRVTKVAPAGDPASPVLEVRYVAQNKTYKTYADLVIDGSGFDRWWFSKLLPKEIGPRFARDRSQAHLEETMDEALAVKLRNYPPLHVPMASLAQGPGLGSLMTMGRMADKILGRYVKISRLEQ